MNRESLFAPIADTRRPLDPLSPAALLLAIGRAEQSGFTHYASALRKLLRRQIGRNSAGLPGESVESITLASSS